MIFRFSNGEEMICPCDSKKKFDTCCEPIIEGQTQANTPEELLRARYTAYTQMNMDFIEATHDPKTLEDFDMVATRQWAKDTEWKSLEVLVADKITPQDKTAEVEFVAEFENKGGPGEHHEISVFKKRNGKWFFSECFEHGTETIVNEDPKIGRNDPCPCESGKKYKKCCLPLED